MNTNNAPAGGAATALPDTPVAHLAAGHDVANIQESRVEYSMGLAPNGRLTYELDEIHHDGYDDNDFVCRTCQLDLEPPA